jgi:hypothetical protein
MFLFSVIVGRSDVFGWCERAGAFPQSVRFYQKKSVRAR